MDAVKEAVRKVRLEEHFTKLLLNRVEASGDRVMRVSFEEFLRMSKDPEFCPLSSYVRDLVEYTNGKLRPQPVRPLLANEVGVYRGKIVVVKGSNPDDNGNLLVQIGAGK